MIRRACVSHTFWLAWAVAGIVVCVAALAADGLDWFIVAMLMCCTFTAGVRAAWLWSR